MSRVESVSTQPHCLNAAKCDTFFFFLAKEGTSPYRDHADGTRTKGIETNADNVFLPFPYRRSFFFVLLFTRTQLPQTLYGLVCQQHPPVVAIPHRAFSFCTPALRSNGACWCWWCCCCRCAFSCLFAWSDSSLPLSLSPRFPRVWRRCISLLLLASTA